MKDILEEKTEDQPDQKAEDLSSGHRQRLKERYRRVGIDGLCEHEVLELLLFFAIPRKDTKKLAKTLLNRFGSLPNVFAASEDQLLSVKGLTPNSAILIRMMMPMWNYCQKLEVKRDNISQPSDCGKVLVDFYKGEDKEVISVVCLNSACKVIAIEKVCEGDVNYVMFDYRRMVEIVLKYPKTSAVILAHNHPGGVALPSRDDLVSTEQIVHTVRSMGINVIDHFVVAGNDYVSMSQSHSFERIFQ